MNIKQPLVRHKARQFLAHYPLFMSVIRTPEAYLFAHYKHYLKNPILDYGCGDGMFAKIALPNSTIDIGLDLVKSRIEEAEYVGNYQSLVHYQGSTIPFPDEFFASVISNSVLEHVDGIVPAVDEIHRVMKKGGYFITSVMTDKWEDYLWGTKLFGVSYKHFMRKKQVHFNLFSRKKLIRLFTNSGFEVIKCIGYLPEKNAQLLDVFHYFSIPALFNYMLFKKWVLFPGLYTRLGIDMWITKRVIEGMKSTQPSASLFFVLRKK